MNKKILSILTTVVMLSCISFFTLLMAQTAQGQIIFSEDWESGINPSKWKVWGNPSPFIETGIGRNNSNALDCNGDANYQSGLVSYQTINLGTVRNISFWINSHARGETPSAYWQNITMGISSTTADNFGSDYNDEHVWKMIVGVYVENASVDNHVYYIVDKYMNIAN